MIALVALVAVAVLGGLHWYVWRRLVRDTTRAWGPARITGTVVLVAGPVLMIAALAAERGGAPFWLQQTLGWPGFLWMALAIYLLLAVLTGEVLRPLLRRFLERRGQAGTAVADGEPQAPSAPASEEAASEEVASAQASEEGASEPASEAAPETPQNAPSRRLFVSRVVGGAAAAAAVGTVGYGTYGVLRGPRVKRVTVPLAKLPRSAHGFRIAVVSDIHLGPLLGRGFAQKVVDTISATQPDLIAVVGDLVDGSVKNLGPAAAPLAGLKARHGSYFVTGNQA